MTDFLPFIDVWSFLTSLDYVVIFFFLLLFLISPKFLKSKNQDHKKQDEYLLMNRGLGLPLFIATLTSTWYGGIFGVTQIAFEHGIYSFFTQGVSWYSAYLIFAFFLAKKIRQRQVRSLPELIGLRFGQSARKLSGSILFFHALPVSYAVSIGIILEIIFAIPFPLAVFLGVGLVALYSITGGMRAIVITDGIQFLLMFLCVILIVVFSIFHFGGINFLREGLPETYFQWQGDKSFFSLFLWFLIACGSTLIHPVFYQRCLAAKDDNTARYGIIIAILCWMLFDCCTTLGGMYAKVIIPNAASDKAYLFYGLQLLPIGLRGFFVIGIIATILSTLDSFLFVSGTSASYDFLGSKKDEIGKHQRMIGLSAFIVILVAIFFKADFESMWLFMEGIFSTSLFLPVMIALFSKRNLAPKIFIVPVIASFLMYSFTTLLCTIYDTSLSPFFLAHGTSLLSLLLLLYGHSQSKTKMPEATYG